MGINEMWCIRWCFIIIIASFLFTAPVWGMRYHPAHIHKLSIGKLQTQSSKQNLFSINPYYLFWKILPKQQPQDLRRLSDHDLKKFFNSFDTVITDLDETLWRNLVPIPGAMDNIKKLENCGKRILFLTNNSVYPKKYILSVLQSMKYNASLDQIITPSDTLIWHLKNIKFNGTIFVIGSKYFIAALEEKGFQVLTGPEEVVGMPKEVTELLTNLNKNVKAVIFDLDANVNYGKIMQAAGYLKRKDVIFLTGNPEKKFSMPNNLTLIGAAPFYDILAEHSSRKPTGYTKSSQILKDYLREIYAIDNPRRTLLVGDSLETDMKFAELCGFQKLWVTSGEDSLDSCHNGCKGSPNYFLPDLGKMPQCQF